MISEFLPWKNYLVSTTANRFLVFLVSCTSNVFLTVIVCPYHVLILTHIYMTAVKMAIHGRFSVKHFPHSRLNSDAINLISICKTFAKKKKNLYLKKSIYYFQIILCKSQCQSIISTINKRSTICRKILKQAANSVLSLLDLTLFRDIEFTLENIE